MSALDALRYRARVFARAVFDRRAWRAELDDEMRFHTELEAMHRRHAGAAPDAADRGARARFGDPRGVRERLFDASGATAVDELRQDLRVAARTLRAAPGFTAVAALTLAVGIGANTAVFSAVDAALLRPLPFAEPERLVHVTLTAPARGDAPARDDVPWSYPKYAAFRGAQTVFSGLAFYADREFTVRAAGGAAERAPGELAGAGYLTTLGISPALGRSFLPDEDRAPGGPRVVLLADALWRRRFGADPGVVGRTLGVGGEPYTVVGVLPPGFRGLSGRAELVVPVTTRPAAELDEADVHGYQLVARLGDGVSADQARAAVRELGRRVDATYPNRDVPGERWGADARPLDATRADPVVRRSLLVLWAAAGVVLLVACANVANLLLLRGAERRRELAVRAALGAGRGRLVRQLLTEGALLTAIGALAGLAVAWAGVRVLGALDPVRALRVPQIGGLGAAAAAPLRLDATALAVAAGLAAVAGALVGGVPAIQATRAALRGAVDDGARGTRRAARGPLGRDALVAAEVALAVLLVAGAGLMVRSLAKLDRVDPGFRPDGVLALRVELPEPFGGRNVGDFYEQVRARVAAIPGVVGAAVTDCLPFDRTCSATPIRLHDRPAPGPGADPIVGVHWASPEAFRVLGVPLRRGRTFAAADRAGAPRVVVVNEAAARAYWPGRDAVGRPVSVGVGPFWDDTATVVGVVGDARYGALDSLPRPEVYIPYAQAPRPFVVVALRTEGEPLVLAGAARQAVRAVSPDAAVHGVVPLAERVRDATAYARFRAALLGAFGGVALALATIGTYGVLAFAAAQRGREFGVRLALGATPGQLARLAVGRGLALAAGGAALGLVLALGAGRALRTLLYDVGPADPGALAAVVAVLAAAAAAAAWGPARRAARVGPSEVLRGA